MSPPGPGGSKTSDPTRHTLAGGSFGSIASGGTLMGDKLNLNLHENERDMGTKGGGQTRGSGGQ